MKGYAINEKRLAALNKTVEIQSKIIANTLEIEEAEVLRAVKLYTDALIRDGQKVISDGALVAITLMVAESNSEEKDIMTTLIMNLLNM